MFLQTGHEMLKGMRLTSVALLTWVALVPVAQAVPVRSVPDVRGQSSVVDLTGTLTPNDKKTIDREAARGRSGGELYVAIIDSTDGEAPRAYATQLFNQLGLDDRARNRGVLLLAALNDRKAEIIVGDGYPSSVTAVTDSIMRDVVVPLFRKNNPRGAMVEGAGALVTQVLLASPERAQSPPSPVTAMPSTSTQADMQRPRPPPPSLPARASSQSEPPGLSRRMENAVDRNPLVFWGSLGGVGFVAFAGARRYLRNRPRSCSRCSQQMVRLDEDQDDKHLTSGERTEETLGSVDYDIWMCPDCQSTIKLRYGAFFTSYSSCRKCGAKTMETDTTTLQHATEYSTGKARVDETCRHCSYFHSYTRTIPRKPRSSRRGSSSSSGSRSSSSSSSSSRGGGSSSGRGSSGSW
jgi:uncharacterized protein